MASFLETGDLLVPVEAAARPGPTKSVRLDVNGATRARCEPPQSQAG